MSDDEPTPRAPAPPRRGLAWLFVHPEERRLRAGFRVALTLGALVLLSLVAQLLTPLLQRGEGSAAAVRLTLGPLFVVGAVAAAAVVGVSRRLLDRRPLSTLGLRASGGFALDLAFGTALGLALIFGVLTAEDALGWARYGELPLTDGSPPRLVYALATVVIYAAVAFYEELVFRAYLIPNVAHGLRGRWLSGGAAVAAATILTSAVFGLAHALNPHASPIATLNIVMAGVMLATGYLLTGELALPIGLHLGWNLAQNLFGMPVSGQRMFHFGALLSREVTGPDWITGGDFGPEAGVTGLVAMVLGAIATVGWVKLRGGALGVHRSLVEDPAVERAARERAAEERPAEF